MAAAFEAKSLPTAMHDVDVRHCTDWRPGSKDAKGAGSCAVVQVEPLSWLTNDCVSPFPFTNAEPTSSQLVAEVQEMPPTWVPNHPLIGATTWSAQVVPESVSMKDCSLPSAS